MPNLKARAIIGGLLAASVVAATLSLTIATAANAKSVCYLDPGRGRVCQVVK